MTDGEFNSLRNQGNERPTNIIQIRANVRNEVKKIGLEKLRRYFMPKRKRNEVIRDFNMSCTGVTAEAVDYHPAVPKTLLREIRPGLDKGKTWIGVIRAERRKLVPYGYEIHTWQGGKSRNSIMAVDTDLFLSEPLTYDLYETEKDCLRSLLAQLQFQLEIRNFSADGVNFWTFLYAPEIDSNSGGEYHDREDHNHILKVICACCAITYW